MASIFTASELANLHERYLKKYAQNTFTRNLILSHIQREKMGGNPHPLTIRLGGGSVGANFQEGLARNKAVSRVKAKIEQALLYGWGVVDGFAQVASEGGENAVVEEMGDAEDYCDQRMAQRLEKFIVDGAGYGTIGFVSSFTGTTAGVTITLKNKSDCLYVKTDDRLVIKDNEATASLRTGYVTVTGVDPSTGIISGTMGGSGDLTTMVAGAAVGHSADMANSTAYTQIVGLRGWITRTGLTADFMGLGTNVRSANPVDLAGWVFSTGTMGIRDVVNALTDAQFGVAGANPKMILMSVSAHRELQDDLGDMVRYEDSSGTVGINFEGIKFKTAAGHNVLCYPHSALDKDVYSLDPEWLHLFTPKAQLFEPRDTRNPDRGWMTMHDTDTKRLDKRFQGSFGVSFPAAQARAIRT